MSDDFCAQHRAVDMGIDLGSGDGFMSQHGLNGTQVGSSLQQVGGKRMTERVRTNGLLDACPFGQLFDEMEHHDA